MERSGKMNGIIDEIELYEIASSIVAMIVTMVAIGFL